MIENTSQWTREMRNNLLIIVKCVLIFNCMFTLKLPSPIKLAMDDSIENQGRFFFKEFNQFQLLNN